MWATLQRGGTFQSTLSLRRATSLRRAAVRRCRNFNPRSPCGERRLSNLCAHQSLYFNPRSPCGERRGRTVQTQFTYKNFNPRSPCGERPSRVMFMGCPPQNFNPRSPCGERRPSCGWHWEGKPISIHALLAESDPGGPGRGAERGISIHALLAESDRSTGTRFPERRYFNPRSPCGERPSGGTIVSSGTYISIHALLAESDHGPPPIHHRQGISFHALLAESDQGRVLLLSHREISIHALLAESDPASGRQMTPACYFNPRSPCGERQIVNTTKDRTKHFNPRSPCGERLITDGMRVANALFQSTLSLRRATWGCFGHTHTPYNFNPRSPCGERPGRHPGRHAGGMDFNPRSPCGERHYDPPRFAR